MTAQWVHSIDRMPDSLADRLSHTMSDDAALRSRPGVALR
jgi:hypothetical protein